MYYLLCQDWKNTSNNHAGIKYLCTELTQRFGNDYRMVSIPDLYIKTSYSLINKYSNSVVRILIRLYIIYEGVLILSKMKKGDVFFMMEYLEKSSPQYVLVPIIKFIRKDIKIYGMVHLVPGKLQSYFAPNEMYKKLDALNAIITLGSSLSSYFIDELHVSSDKVKTLFHYVDDSYYCKNGDVTDNPAKITVIAMGNQMRNITILKEIVNKLPEIDFIICQGSQDMRTYFSHNNNVRLIPFVPEDKLKKLMDSSDISLNCMLDTIGSNVIVTSMAMGLAMICSDVGSIHDYCGENNCIFCHNNEDFVDAIKYLSQDKQKLFRMKQNSIIRSKQLSIESFHQEIQKIK